MLKKKVILNTYKFLDLVERDLLLLKSNSSVQNQHISVPQTSKKVKCFGDVSFTSLGEKKD